MTLKEYWISELKEPTRGGFILCKPVNPKAPDEPPKMNSPWLRKPWVKVRVLAPIANETEGGKP